jgi:hypothetical protein
MCGVFQSVQSHFNSKAHSFALQTYKDGADENVWLKDRGSNARLQKYYYGNEIEED